MFVHHCRQEVREADPRNVRCRMDQQYDARISVLEAYTWGHQTGMDEVTKEMSAITNANGMTTAGGSRTGSHGSNFGTNGANSGGRTVGGRAHGWRQRLGRWIRPWLTGWLRISLSELGNYNQEIWRPNGDASYLCIHHQ